MKITRNAETYKTVIEITDLDLHESRSGDALYLLCKLVEAIQNHGNLPVYDGTRCELDSVHFAEAENFGWPGNMPDKWFLVG